MPKLKTFSADLSPGSINSGERAQASPVGGAIADLGQSMSKTSDYLLAEQERTDAQNAYTELAQARQQAIQKLDELQQAGKPASGEMQNVLDAAVQDVRQNRTTKYGLSIVDHSAANMIADIGHSARMADAQLAGQQAKEQMASMVNANGDVLQRDPSLLSTITQEQEIVVDHLTGLTPEQRTTIKRQMNQEAAKNAVRGWIAIDPKQAGDRLNKGEWDKFLEPDAKAALIANAEAQVRSDESQARIAAQEARLTDSVGPRRSHEQLACRRI